MTARTLSGHAFLVLGVLFVGSEMLYLWLLRLDAINGVGPVSSVLCILGVLFTLYGASCGIASGRRRVFCFVLSSGLIFGVTLVPAGLPAEAAAGAKLSMLPADVTSRRVSYEPFLPYDSDIWRYLCEGHVWASGINPYRTFGGRARRVGGDGRAVG